MENEFDLQKYITDGVEHFVKASLKATLKNPRETAFLAKFAIAAKRSAAYRRKREEEGLHIPAFLITSITSSCNLHCEGCYSRDTHATSDAEPENQLTDEEWADIFRQAADLGVSFIVLAGGEPLLRKGVIEAAADTPGILFPVFTNGVYLSGEYKELFNKNRNLLPVLSIEGTKEMTDARRGAGIYDMVAANMADLKKKGIVFGASATITKDNLRECLSDVYIEELSEKGVQFIFFVEYVSVGGDNAEAAPDDKDREYMNERVAQLRKQYTDLVFVSIPGDEKASGGCLAAGRGFFHINSQGDAEACPMSPYSDMNIRENSLEEVLNSPLFNAIKENGLLAQEHDGGCSLALRDAQVKELL